MLLICGLSAVIATLGLSATFAPPEFTIAIAVAGAAMLVLIFVYGLRWLQYHEFLEAGASLTSAAMRGRTLIRDKIHARDVATLLRAADSFEHLSAILEHSAARFRFVHMELQGRSATRELDEPIAVQVHGTPTWKLEYPIERAGSTLVQPIFVSIWSETSAPPGAVRVAQILAPAVGDWFAAHWERPELQDVLADRFPGIVTPTHSFPTISSDFSRQNSARVRGTDARRQLRGD